VGTTRRGIQWSVSGHGGSYQSNPSPPKIDDEISEKRREVDRIETQLFAARAELRDAITRRERRPR
jgi:hypothetical protein